MTDPGPFPDSDLFAELVNDYVDGTIDRAARVRVERSAQLRAAVDEQRRTRTLLGVFGTAPPGARAAAIAAALAEHDDAGRAPDPDSVADRTVPLAAARRRRMRWVSASAAAVVVAVGATAIGMALGRSRGAEKSAAGVSVAGVSVAGVSVAGVSVAGVSVAGVGAATAAPAADRQTEAASTIVTIAAAASPTTVATRPPTATNVSATGSAGGSSGGTTPPATPVLGEPIVVESPEGLLALARPSQSSTAGSTAGSGAGGSIPATTTTVVDAAPAAPSTNSDGCLGPHETLLATIVYRATPAIAVVDDLAHVRRARDVATCAVLVEIADAP